MRSRPRDPSLRGDAPVVGLFVGLVALLLFAVGCRDEKRLPPPSALGAGASLPRRGGALVLGLAEDVRTLDPAMALDDVSGLVTPLLFGTLLDYAPADAPDPTALVPSLARSWSVSADGRAYTFELREDARFSSGEPVLAEDFVYALDRLLSPSMGSPVAQFYAGITGAADRLAGKSDHAEGLCARGPRTLEIRLDRPDPSFPLLVALTASTPLKRRHVDAVGAHIRDTPLGTGPFQLAAYKPGQRMELARNPTYWDPERPYLDRITLEILMPRNAMMPAFLRGDIHLMEGLITDDVLLFAQDPAWAPHVERTPQMRSYTELMNTRRPPFDDRRVRRAFNYAINKEDSVRLSNGRAIVANGFLPPAMPGYDPSRAPYPHAPDEARRLLAEAGHAGGLEVTYTTIRDDLLQKMAQSIQADLAEVGVRVNIEVLTFPAYLNAMSQGEISFGFSGWFMDFPDPWDFLEVKYHSRMIEGGTNETFYSNPEVDRLLDAARRELDHEKRVALYRRAERIIYDDCPSVFHYFPVALDVHQPYLRAAKRHPVRGLFLRDAWLDEPHERAP